MPGYVKTGQKLVVASCLVALLGGCGSPETETVSDSISTAATSDADIIIVGAGLAGLSAAIDAASAGARVLVIDMNSVFGGHGIQSGGVAFINSTLQEELGYEDDPDVDGTWEKRDIVPSDPSWICYIIAVK